MGQSINTTGFLLSSQKNWPSKWFNDYNYCYLLHEDILIRNYIFDILKELQIYVSKCIINRSNIGIKIYINIYIKSRKISKETNNEIISNTLLLHIKETLSKLTKNKIQLYICFTTKIDSAIISQYIKKKIELRTSPSIIFNRVLSKIKQNNNKDRINGIKIQFSGRPNGNDMASISWFKDGEIPLHSYNKNIDYSFITALTKYGICGIKVWICFNNIN